MRKCLQISLFDIYNDISTSFEEKKPELISLLDENIDFDALIPWDLKASFYCRYGRKHKYHFVSYIKALVLEKLLNLCDSQLIAVLKCSRELRDFCEFDKVPDASYFTRFKQKYCQHIVKIFENLVEITEPICREINEKRQIISFMIQPALSLRLLKTTPSFSTQSLSRQRLMQKILLSIHIRLYISCSLIMPLQILLPNSSIQMGIFAMLLKPAL